jgi:hypothetical protein
MVTTHSKGDDINLLQKIEEIFACVEIIKLRMEQEGPKATAIVASFSSMETEDLIGELF